MDIAQLFDLDLTGVARPIHLLPVEPAEVSTEAVAGLAGVLTETATVHAAAWRRRSTTTCAGAPTAQASRSIP